MRHQDDKLEESSHRLFNQENQRCENVEEDDDKIALYIDELSKTIKIIVARHRESFPRRQLTFEDLFHFAHAED